MITKQAAAHRGKCGCPHCKPKQPAAPAPAAREPIPLPEQPTPIRVHSPGRPPQDCTLHPDGSLTATLAGRPHRNALSLDDMLATNWEGARIELNPAPLPHVDGGGGAPADTSVQDALPLGDTA
ncbi:hypothetical protein AB0D90_14670 [Streptomyces althioticus]|uniref:hypothetical protein n=1 Tax=Streptomyces althioticus TaxID=83380 RepID=UPI0033E03602